VQRAKPKSVTNGHPDIYLCDYIEGTTANTFRLREHRHNLQPGLLEKSKLAQYSYEEGHRVGWDDAKILEIGSNSRYRKFKESANMADPIR
jgi:hypothetical protein